MKHKPPFFSIERKLEGSDYIFYESKSDQHDRVYVPRTEKDFNDFIDALWRLIPRSEISTEMIRNKNLIKRYPWLFVKNRFDGGIYLFDVDGSLRRDWFNYFEGHSWPAAQLPFEFFQMQEELRNEFLNTYPEYLYLYEIMDMKEKYGTFRWYDAGCTEGGRGIVDKYCKIFEDLLDLKYY